MKTGIKKTLRYLALALGVVIVALSGFLALAYARSSNECVDGKPPAPRTPIRAIVYCEYGSSEVLKLATVEKPVPADSQVLVRVRAASVNPLDWHYMRGTPYLMRLDGGLKKPKVIRMGVDFAGVVEAVGSKVKHFKPGDEVFGARTGAFGEYITIWEERIGRKPANVTFEQMAATPVSALTALQALRDQGELKPGDKVLINGASGGVGTFAVQLAKSMGAQVTGVCSTRNVELVKSLGADHVIDYKKDDISKRPERYDVIIDNVGNHSLSTMRDLLTENGRYVMVGGQSGKWLDPLPRAAHAALKTKLGGQPMRFFISQSNRQDYELLAAMLQSGKLRPVIDRTYPLAQTPAAVAYVEQGHARAKVIVTID